MTPFGIAARQARAAKEEQAKAASQQRSDAETARLRQVASREVEETVYRLDGVSEVAVVGLPHPYWIEAVTAVVVRKPGAGSMTEDEVIAHCRAQMAHFKVPKKVIFVDALPKNPSGKLLKRELRTRYEATMKDLPAAGR